MKKDIYCPCCEELANKDLLLYTQDFQAWDRSRILEQAQEGKGRLQAAIGNRSELRWACQNCLNTGRAILADSAKQIRWCNIFCLAYYDIPLQCTNCQKSFIHTKEEQRVWYEEYQLPMRFGPSHPGLCRDCRYTRRNRVRLQHKLQDQLQNFNPKSPNELLEIARLYAMQKANRKAVLFYQRAKNRAEGKQRENIIDEYKDFTQKKKKTKKQSKL